MHYVLRVTSRLRLIRDLSLVTRLVDDAVAYQLRVRRDALPVKFVSCLAASTMMFFFSSYRCGLAPGGGALV